MLPTLHFVLPSHLYVSTREISVWFRSGVGVSSGETGSSAFASGVGVAFSGVGTTFDFVGVLSITDATGVVVSGCLFFNDVRKFFIHSELIYQFLSATLTEKSRIRPISSGENQASVRAFVCSGAVGAVPLLDIIEDRMICVIFGSSLVYTALLFHCTLGLPNAILGVVFIIGTSTLVGVGVGSIDGSAFVFLLPFPPDGFAPSNAQAV